MSLQKNNWIKYKENNKSKLGYKKLKIDKLITNKKFYLEIIITQLLLVHLHPNCKIPTLWNKVYKN